MTAALKDELQLRMNFSKLDTRRPRDEVLSNDQVQSKQLKVNQSPCLS